MSGGEFGSPGPTRKVAAAAAAGGSRGGAAPTWTTKFRSELSCIASEPVVRVADVADRFDG